MPLYKAIVCTVASILNIITRSKILRLYSLVYNPLAASTVISHCNKSLPLYCVTSVPVAILFQEETNAIAVATLKDNGCRSIFTKN